MDDDIHTPESQQQAVAVADIAEEEAHLGHLVGAEDLFHIAAHFVLLQLVARQDDDLLRIEAGQQGVHHPAAEGPGASGDQHRLAFDGIDLRREIAQGRKAHGQAPQYARRDRRRHMVLRCA